MLHLIGKNLWARRYRNGWLLAELIIVSMVIWVLTDPIVVTTHDRGLPTGITEEGMYRLNLAAVSSKSARFEAGEDTPEARAANVRRILSRIRDYEDVRYATLQFRDVRSVLFQFMEPFVKYGLFTLLSLYGDVL